MEEADKMTEADFAKADHQEYSQEKHEEVIVVPERLRGLSEEELKKIETKIVRKADMVIM